MLWSAALTVFFSLQTDGELLKGDVLTADPLFLLPLGNPNTFSTTFNGSKLFFFFLLLKDKSTQGCKTCSEIRSSNVIVIWRAYNTILEEFVSFIIDLKIILTTNTIPSRQIAVVAHTCLFLSVTEHPRKTHENSCKCKHALFNSVCTAARVSFQGEMVLLSSWKFYKLASIASIWAISTCIYDAVQSTTVSMCFPSPSPCKQSFPTHKPQEQVLLFVEFNSSMT